MPVELICECCNSEYSVIPSRAEESRFCSMECKGDYQRESDFNEGESNPFWSGGHKETSVCETCGDDYERRSDRIGKFCSRECCDRWWKNNAPSGPDHPRWKSGPVELICEYCGEGYTVKRAREEKSRFCSYNCLSLWRSENKSGEDSHHWKGGAEKDYGPLWNRIREEVRERDGECVSCGMGLDCHQDEYGRKMDVHHIVPIKEFDRFEKANDMENLVSLCRECHAKVESGEKNLSVSSPYE